MIPYFLLQKGFYYTQAEEETGKIKKIMEIFKIGNFPLHTFLKKISHMHSVFAAEYLFALNIRVTGSVLEISEWWMQL